MLTNLTGLDKAGNFLLYLHAHWKLEMHQRTKKHSNLKIPVNMCHTLMGARER